MMKLQDIKQKVKTTIKSLIGEKLYFRLKIYVRINKNKDCKDLYRICLKHIVPVKSPLVLISQIQRSGGTLLSQLFDGHPECFAHPYELYIGYPDKTIWPTLQMDSSPVVWFETLFENPAAMAFRDGYRKYDRGCDEKPEVFPFIFLPSLQREIFFKIIASTKIESPRDIFDAYMTSYFNAWLNNRNIYGEKKVITGFVPRMATYEDNVKNFFDVYPDGKLLSIIRAPQSWYVSARVHRGPVEYEYKDIQNALHLWKKSAQTMLKNKLKYPDQVCIIRFEDLVGKTEAVMRFLAAYLNIGFDEILLTPTFNKLPIKANSSYKVKTHGVMRDSITRHKKMLNKDEIDIIDSLAQDTYENILKETAQF